MALYHKLEHDLKINFPFGAREWTVKTRPTRVAGRLFLVLVLRVGVSSRSVVLAAHAPGSLCHAPDSIVSALLTHHVCPRERRSLRLFAACGRSALLLIYMACLSHFASAPVGSSPPLCFLPVLALLDAALTDPRALRGVRVQMILLFSSMPHMAFALYVLSK